MENGKEWNTKYTKKDGTFLGKYENGKWRKCFILLYISRDGVDRWYEDGDEEEDSKYVGEIKNRLPNGQGTMTSPNGRKYIGEFKKDGEIWNGTVYGKDGNIIYKVVNGEWIRYW